MKLTRSVYCGELLYSHYGAFTLTESETDKMATVPNDISVFVQYEHLNTILQKQFFEECKCGIDF